jgi:hypothetical protein
VENAMNEETNRFVDGRIAEQKRLDETEYWEKRARAAEATLDSLENY